jgi:hypothetical protein
MSVKIIFATVEFPQPVDAAMPDMINQVVVWMPAWQRAPDPPTDRADIGDLTAGIIYRVGNGGGNGVTKITVNILAETELLAPTHPANIIRQVYAAFVKESPGSP